MNEQSFIDRFKQIVGSTEPHGVSYQIKIIVTAQDNRAAVIMLFVDDREQFNAGADRHFNIGDQNIHRLLRKKLRGNQTIFTGENRQFLLGKMIGNNAFQSSENMNIIIHEQNSHGACYVSHKQTISF